MKICKIKRPEPELFSDNKIRGEEIDELFSFFNVIKFRNLNYFNTTRTIRRSNEYF